jgi:hypothetical protein
MLTAGSRLVPYEILGLLVRRVEERLRRLQGRR